MTRRLKKKFKYTFIIIVLIFGSIVGYKYYKGINNNMEKEEIKEEKKQEEIEEPPIKEEVIIEEKPYQKIINDNGIFNEYYEKAYDKLETMTLDEKISQIFLVRVPKEYGTNILEQYQFGGYLLFGRDVTNITKEGLIEKISNYQRVSKIPSIIAIDEEGGTISRLNSNSNIVPNPFPSPMELYKEGGIPKIVEDLRNKNSLLEELGINLNLAPVVDIADENTFIYKRTIGGTIEETSNYAAKVVETSKESKVSYTLKHFPGYGNNVDTHTGIAIDERSLEELKNKDLLPFKSGIDAGAECILVSHNIINSIDNERPASLSLKVHNLLRNDLAFTGIIITDDLYMDAIKKYQEHPSISALTAGNDLIIITDYEQGINEIKEAINNNIIDINILNKAVIRVLAWKYYKGLIE